MTRAVLALNAGSSSIKLALFRVDESGDPWRAATGKLDGIGVSPRLTITAANGSRIASRDWPDGAGLTHEQLLGELYALATGQLPEHEIVGVGHRVVHGGAEFVAPVRLDDEAIGRIEALSSLAPLHQPHNVAAIRAIAARAPGIPQVACFDTAFHHTMPPVATRLAIPHALADKGIRRYGFHGLSYEFIGRRLAEIDPILAAGRVVVAHLGNGASLCAMAAGKSIDTTMSFTALDGLVMGTRPGTLDPGVVLHLLDREEMAARDVATMLYHQSGLLGVSGISSDMRALHASDDPRAAEAVELFCWRAAREVGGLVSSLGGLDGLVFTGGIGENDAAVRAAIAARLAWTGLMLDEAANAGKHGLISAAGGRVAARVIPTDEELMIALHTLETLGLATGTANRGDEQQEKR